MSLARGEAADVHCTPRVDAHAFERGSVRDGSNDKIAIPFEPNEPAVEEVIDTGRQKQAVLAFEPFFV